MIVIGVVLMIVSWLMLWAIVVGLLPTAFLLNFLAYAASIGGMVLGVIGVLQHFATRQ